MSVEIVWPGPRRQLDDREIDKWFMEAVMTSIIEPQSFKEETTMGKARALENAGVIRLAVST